jgi:hypothetical protein
VIATIDLFNNLCRTWHFFEIDHFKGDAKIYQSRFQAWEAPSKWLFTVLRVGFRSTALLLH